MYFHRSNPAGHLGAEILDALTVKEWAMVIALIVVGVWTNQAVATWLGWPQEPRFSASILASARPIAGVATLVIAMIVSLALGSIILGRARYEAGLFAAACGLAALASRGGTVSAAIRSANRPAIYTTFLLETAMLLGTTCLAWLSLALFRKVHWTPRPTPNRAGVINLFMACLIQMMVTGLLVLLFARSDVTKQALAAVFLASLLAAIAAHQTFPTSSSLPFWGGTLLAGIAGFAWAAARPGQWQIGIPANDLANIPPLGYASLGVAGALLGYWVSLRWHATAEDDQSDIDLFGLPLSDPTEPAPE